ncbi:sensor histidine kinase [Trinickia diaoshuihuensis]|uniref:sensor histidine kinase n=1 Tax=Trinickia diaoshuihuensis TaxID=2292265 RepID=UPI000E269A74|nr:ATP-binding protein [Trinickia diaoshuihuensis]
MRRVAVFLLLAWIAIGVGSSASGEAWPAVTLRDAQFVATDSAVPPHAGWQPIALPDSWRINHPQLSGYAWYRIAFTLKNVPTEPLALYVPHVSLVGRLWLNGSLLNPEAVFDAADGKMGSSMSDVPLYLVLPSGLFHPGENVLDIRLEGSSRVRSGISAPVLGAVAELEPRWRLRYTLQVTIPNVLLVVMAAAACFFAAHLHHQRRLHLFQLAALAAFVNAVLYLSMQLPIGREVLLVLRVAGNIVLHWAVVVIACRMAGERGKRFLRVWHIVTFLTVVAVAGYGATGVVTDRIWMLTWPHLLLRFVAVYLILERAWRERSVVLAALAITGAIWLLSLAQSYLLLMEVFPWDHFRSSPSGSAPFGIVLIFYWAGQFILDRQQAAVAQQGAINAERGRILQEMHDGMGAHLTAALHLARRGEAAQQELIGSIEESLQDLRAIIDSLDLFDGNLLPLLANLRFRIEPRLKALGIQLTWDVATPFPRMTGLTPQSALSVLRIVQECINNVLKHAKARFIHFAAHPEGVQLCITVRDDGCGFDPSRTGTGGRGLNGMRVRAENLKGTLHIRSYDRGTTVELRIPL